MDWFERLTGFRETSYEETRKNLQVNGKKLRSLVNGNTYNTGELELVSLRDLRSRVHARSGLPGRLKVSTVTGDVRRLHQVPEFRGALFQVASQFNLLEMVSPEVTPEMGVTRYQSDPTQGPACAMAAGAATIYRNYFASVGGQQGQTDERQFDGLEDLGAALAGGMERPEETLWTMRNGYALCSRQGLDAITRYLRTQTSEQTDALRGMLRIGVHSDVEITDVDGPRRPLVSQAFCSALPVAYTSIPPLHWQSFASLVLQAAYEATMWAGVLNARRGASNIVLLTRIGGSAFGNEGEWIHAAMRRAFEKVSSFDVDVRIVSYGSTSHEIMRLAEEFR